MRVFACFLRVFGCTVGDNVAWFGIRSHVYSGIWLGAWMCAGFVGAFAGGVVRKFCGDMGERGVSEMVIDLCLVCEGLVVI